MTHRQQENIGYYERKQLLRLIFYGAIPIGIIALPHVVGWYLGLKEVWSISFWTTSVFSVVLLGWYAFMIHIMSIGPEVKWG